MPVRHRLAARFTLLCTALLASVFLSGCGRQAPNAPTGDRLLISGHVYQAMTRGSGEPPIAGVLITVKAEDGDGVETSSSSDQRGFYRVRAASGAVVVTAAKAGYTTRESRFEVADSTVLNFSLMPETQSPGP